jgi:hypothetical protein
MGGRKEITRVVMREQGSFDVDRTTFDLGKGEKRKEEGLALAASTLSRKQLLEMARLCAIRVVNRFGEVTYDDVFYEMIRQGLDPIALGNAAGSIFRGKEFIFTGRWEKSRRVSNHARVNRVWRLNNDYVPLKKNPLRAEILGDKYVAS